MRSLLHLFSHRMNEWLLQRLTAIVMTLYILAFAVVLLLSHPLDYVHWHGLFELPAVRIASFAFFVSLLLHAWIGVQDVLSDYVKPNNLRGILKFTAGAVLVVLGVWAIWILWEIGA